MAGDIAREILAALPQSTCVLLVERPYNHVQGVCVRKHLTGFHVSTYGGRTHGEHKEMCSDEVFLGTSLSASEQVWALLQGMRRDGRGVDVLYAEDPPSNGRRKRMQSHPADEAAPFLSYLTGMLNALDHVRV